MTITDNVTDTKDSSSFSPYNTKVTVVIQPHQYHHTFRLRIIQINDVYELDQLPKFKSLLNEYTMKRSDTSHNDNNNHNDNNDTNENADHTIVICCGDFVAPSLLSSLDEGYSMIDILNLCGIDYVCLGNHETDISISALHDRIVHQSQFTWINSNIIPSSFSSSSSLSVMNDHSHDSSNNKKMTLPWKHLPEYCEIVLHLLDTTEDDGNAVVDDDNVVVDEKEVTHKTLHTPQQQQQRIVLLGLLTEDPSLYRPNQAFGGNVTILPILERTKEYIQTLFRNSSSSCSIDDGDDDDGHLTTTTPLLIIPMTHQSIQHDRTLAEAIGHICPIICGGHDHEIYHEFIRTNNVLKDVDTTTTSSSSRHHHHQHHYDTCQIVKAGMDAQNAAIIDIVWCNRNDNDTTHNDDEKNEVCNLFQTKPTIQVQMVSTLSYEPDPVVQERVHQHQQILQELEQAKLFRIDDWAQQVVPQQRPTTTTTTINNGTETNIPPVMNTDSTLLVEPSPSSPPLSFSTMNNRIQSSTGTTAICTMLQMGMRTQLCIMNAGAIRGNTNYPLVTTTIDTSTSTSTNTDTYFTWAHLKNEIPFRTDMCVCTIPGRVIEQMIDHSRLGSYQHIASPIASGGYLHTCRNVQMQEEDVVVTTTTAGESEGSDSNNTITTRKVKIVSIGNEPFDPDRGYLVALPKQFLDGIDNHVPLLEWANTTDLSYISDETCTPAKMVLVQVFAATMWLQMGQFHEIDLNQDGMISRDEIRHRLIQLNDGKGEHVADLIVDNLLSICDLNEDGMISPIEMMVCQYVATDMLRHVGTRDEIRTITNIVMNVLGNESPSNFNMTDMNMATTADITQVVERIRQTIDVHGDGSINRNDISEIFKGTIQRGNDLLL